MKKFLYILGGTLLTLVILVLGAATYVWIKLDSNTLTREVRNLLTDVLATEVKLKKCEIDPMSQNMAVYGLNIKDRKNVDMLHVDTLQLKVNVLQLLRNRLKVYSFNLSGAHVILYKERKDSAANYQFVVDAVTFITKDFRSNKPKGKKKKLQLDLRSVRVANTSVQWDVRSEKPRNTPTWKQFDPNHINIANVNFYTKLESGGSPGSFVGELKRFYAKECNSLTEVGIKEVEFNGIKRTFLLDKAEFKYQDMRITLNDINGRMDKDSVTTLDIPRLTIYRNNHKPKKNVGKPNRGAFDPGHLNAVVSLHATATYLTVDSASLTIDSLKGVDYESGLKVDMLTANLIKSGRNLYVTHLKVRDARTTVRAALVNLSLPSKHNPHGFKLEAKNVRAHAVLQDVWQPFSPRLKNFTTPVEAVTDISGNEKELSFDRIYVYTRDGRLQATGNGIVKLGKKKLGKKTEVEFNVTSCTARGGIKAQILGHFRQISPSLVTMLTNIGDVRFKGNIRIPFKHVFVKGKLNTVAGDVDANIAINAYTHKMTGSAKSDSLDLKTITGKPKLGPIAFTSSFEMLLKRRKPGQKKVKGQLPVGNLSGRVIKAKYGILRLKDIDFNITTDGKAANGHIESDHKLLNISVDFSFQGADIKNTLKVKPHVKFSK